MTVFSTLKHSTFYLFSFVIGWSYPLCAETLEILKTYDQNNKNNEVEAVIQFKIADDKNKLKFIDKSDVSITSNGEYIENFRLIKPEDTTPDPSRIIILLDMSGSMALNDSSGQVRGIAALQAIRSFIDYLKSDNYPSEVAVVPFATDGFGCAPGAYLPPPVDNIALSKFYSPSSETLITEISNLENTFNLDNSKLPCGGTDIRNPVKNAVEYLNSNYSAEVTSEGLEEETSERLGIILLSDGFDQILSDSKLQDDKELGQLETFLKKNKNDITLHTLGYGEEGSEDIDIEVLQRLASASGGINLFSANSRQINEALTEFLVSLVGKYEINYKPTSIKQYELEKAEITVGEHSEEKEFRIQNIPSLSLQNRILILAGTLVFCSIFGLLPFLGWRWWLEREA